MGCATPVGVGREALWEAYRTGKSGIGRIRAFDPEPFPVQIAGEVRDFDPSESVSRKDRQHVSRSAVLAIGAARQALRDARIDLEACDLEARRRIAVLVGSGGGGLEFTERQYGHYFRGEPRKASVYTIPTSTIGTLSSEISMGRGTYHSHLLCSARARQLRTPAPLP